MKNFHVSAAALAVFLAIPCAEAAIGSKGSVGMSRSITTAIKPKPTYSAPSYSTSGYSRSRSTSSYPDQRYRDQRPYSYNQPAPAYSAPQQRSAMGEIGIGVASVAGGMLAADAIRSLVASPSHPGMYTSPTNPGVMYNAQGVPQSVPAATPAVDIGAAQQPPYSPAQAPQPVYVQQPQENSGMFPFWGFVSGLLELIATVFVTAGVAYGGWKLYGWGRKKIGEHKMIPLHNDIDNKAHNMFVEFNKNADNKEWLDKNTVGMNTEHLADKAASVVSCQHEVIDVSVEHGYTVSTVRYIATLEEKDGGRTKVDQAWHYRHVNGEWKLCGVEAV